MNGVDFVALKGCCTVVGGATPKRNVFGFEDFGITFFIDGNESSPAIVMLCD